MGGAERADRNAVVGRTCRIGLERFSGDGGRMALVCGPEAMETSVKEALLGMGWKSDELLFF